MYCSECGKENKETARFCGNCGTRLTEESINKPVLQRAPKTLIIGIIGAVVMGILVWCGISFIKHKTILNKIVFVSDRDGNQEIYIMDSDGSNQIRLTNTPEDEFLPVWSPNGKKVAFTSNADTGNFAIWVIDADGGNKIKLAINSLLPDWSPDGKRIAYTHNEERPEIWVMDANGGNKNKIAIDGILPRWSPDGKKIAFVSYKEEDTISEIYVMDVDGTNKHKLTAKFCSLGHPLFDWSPDGKKIAFSSLDDETYDGTCGIYIVSTDEANQRGLKINHKRYIGKGMLYKIGNLSFRSDKGWFLTIKLFEKEKGLMEGITIKNSYPDGYLSLWIDAKRAKWKDNIWWLEEGVLRKFNQQGLLVKEEQFKKKKIQMWSPEEIWMINQDEKDISPHWSPDNKRIAFVSLNEEERVKSELYVSNIDGTKKVKLNFSPKLEAWGDCYLSWNPNGNKIAAVSEYNGNKEIYVMNADGTNQINITKNPANDFLPDWH